MIFWKSFIHGLPLAARVYFLHQVLREFYYVDDLSFIAFGGWWGNVFNFVLLSVPDFRT